MWSRMEIASTGRKEARLLHLEMCFFIKFIPWLQLS